MNTPVVLPISNDCDKLDEVVIVTTHFNPCKYHSQKRNYYRWKKTLGPLARKLQCAELVFDDDTPEIENSFVIRGTRAKHLMFQKEPLINVILNNTPKHVKYFAWIDHDYVINDPDWLDKSIQMMNDETIAVQLFSKLHWLNNNDIIIRSHNSTVYTNTKQNALRGMLPGGAWIMRHDLLKTIGGMYCGDIIGGGDQIFCDTLIHRNPDQIIKNKYSLAHTTHATNWINNTQMTINNVHTTYLDSEVYHLFHGISKDRQYINRHVAIKESNYNPDTDVIINNDGILEFTGNNPQLRDCVSSYFTNRNEDMLLTSK